MGHFETDQLPFKRGTTLSGGITLSSPTGGAQISQIPTSGYLYGLPLPANYYGKGVVGKVYDALNGVTGEPIKLRAVQWGSTDLTVVLSTLVIFDITTTAAIHGRFGKVAIPVASSAGLVAKVIDHAYPAGFVISAGDVFWVVERGLTPVKATAAATIVVGNELSCDTTGNGYGVKVAAQGDKVIGIAQSPTYTAAADPYTGLLTATGLAATPGSNVSGGLILMEACEGLVLPETYG